MAKEEKHQMFYPNFGAVIIAQPGDEALWAGGTLLMHPETKWTILSLCGGSDPELESRFNKVVEIFGAQGIIGHFQADANDVPSQFQVQKAIGKLMFSERFDVIITHTFWGEFEHTEMASITAKSVLGMTRTGQLTAKQILQFACEKKEESPLITPVQEADVLIELNEEIMDKKFHIVTDIYGHSQDTIAVKSLSNVETFWLLGQTTYTERKREQKKKGILKKSRTFLSWLKIIMHIDSYRFGKIVINAIEYSSDCIITGNQVKADWWRKSGHLLSIDDLESIIQANPKVLIIGTGASGIMKVPQEVLERLEQMKIKAEVLKTPKAVERFNEFSKTQGGIAAAFHLTC